MLTVYALKHWRPRIELRQLELAPFGVDVVASALGLVRSGFERAADMRMGMAGTPALVAAETLRALGRKGAVRPD